MDDQTIISMWKNRKNRDLVAFISDGYNHESHLVKQVSEKDGEVLEIISEYDEIFSDEIQSLAYFKKGAYKRKKETLIKDKRPKTGDKDRYVGIELEFLSQLNETEIESLLLKANLEDHVSLRDDGSLDTEDDYRYSHEICVLAKEKDVKKIIKKLTSILIDSSTVNTSCGMHVHLDMRHRKPAIAYRRLVNAQPILYSINPKSRVNNTYCEMQRTGDFNHAKRMGRYYGINASAITKHKTIEVRIHAGTLNASKIVNWVELLLEIVKNPLFDRPQGVNLPDKMKLKRKLKNYVKARQEKFQEVKKNLEQKIAA